MAVAGRMQPERRSASLRTLAASKRGGGAKQKTGDNLPESLQCVHCDLPSTTHPGRPDHLVMSFCPAHPPAHLEELSRPGKWLLPQSSHPFKAVTTRRPGAPRVALKARGSSTLRWSTAAAPACTPVGRGPRQSTDNKDAPGKRATLPDPAVRPRPLIPQQGQCPPRDISSHVLLHTHTHTAFRHRAVRLMCASIPSPQTLGVGVHPRTRVSGLLCDRAKPSHPGTREILSV